MEKDDRKFGRRKNPGLRHKCTSYIKHELDTIENQPPEGQEGYGLFSEPSRRWVAHGGNERPVTVVCSRVHGGCGVEAEQRGAAGVGAGVHPPMRYVCCVLAAWILVLALSHIGTPCFAIAVTAVTATSAAVTTTAVARGPQKTTWLRRHQQQHTTTQDHHHHHHQRG